MQNLSLLLSASTLNRRQSIAALLPEEILDLVFAVEGFFLGDSTDDGLEGDENEEGRARHLSDLSVVAEGWTTPARRLLFRTVQIIFGAPSKLRSSSP